MTHSDYMRLAKLSLDSRKKNTKSTVRGIAIGLIFLIPVIYIVLGIYMGLNGQVNRAPELLTVQVAGLSDRNGAEPLYPSQTSADYAITTAPLELGAAKVNSNYYLFEPIISMRHYRTLTTNLSNSGSGAGEWNGNMGTEGNTYAAFDFALKDSSGNDLGSNSYYFGINDDHIHYSFSNERSFAAILDSEKSTAMQGGRFEPNKMKDRYDGSIFINGMDKNFTGDGKGQVILNEYFIKLLGYDAAEVYGKRISLNYLDESNIGNGIDILDGTGVTDDEGRINGTHQVNFITDYEVVGVIKSQITEDIMQSDGGHLLSLMSNAMFFTAASRGNATTVRAVEPTITVTETANEYGYTNTTNTAEFKADYDRLAGEYIGLGANKFSSLMWATGEKSSGETVVIYAPQYNLLVDPVNYNEMEREVSVLSATFSPFLSSEHFGYACVSTLYSMVSAIYRAFMIVILILAIFGGIVLFAAIVNLFNTVAHSVDTRKHYLGVMRAIGARGNVITKMYIYESVRIFIRASIWVLIFASIVCVGIMMSINYGFSFINEGLSSIAGITLGLHWAYIPLAIVIGIAVIIAVGFTFCYLLSYKVSKSKITNLLVD